MKLTGLFRLLGGLAILVIVAPIIALTSKVPWSSLFAHLIDLTAVKLSLWTSTLSATLAALLGVPLAWVLAKSDTRFTNFIRPLVLAPIVLPPTVAGIALISLMGRNGLFGSYLYKEIGRAHV